jgi:hypothetical protein
MLETPLPDIFNALLDSASERKSLKGILSNLNSELQILGVSEIR